MPVLTATPWESFLRDQFVHDELEGEHFTQLEDEGLIATYPTYSADDLATAEAKYLTHDNGGRPYLVSIHDSGKVIRVFRKSEQESEDVEVNYDLPVLEIPRAIRFWPAIDKGEPSYLGNSFLVQVSPQDYIRIEGDVVSFTSTSKVTEYYSEVGNNDVPYAFALTDSGRIIIPIGGVVLDPIPDFDRKFAEDRNLPFTLYYNGEVKSERVQLTTIFPREIFTASRKRSLQTRGEDHKRSIAETT